MPIVLASASPQRSRLLAGLGVAFEVMPSAVDEDAHPESDPARRAVVLAEAKVADVAAERPDDWIIGCDTLVESADGALLEKPADAAAARAMIERLNGRTCLVHSGLCVRGPGAAAADLSTSRVTFASLSEADVDWWIGTGLWRDRSGAFQIDGPGQLMIERVEGDWTGVVGLPVFLLGQLAARVGLRLR